LTAVSITKLLITIVARFQQGVSLPIKALAHERCIPGIGQMCPPTFGDGGVSDNSAGCLGPHCIGAYRC
jgi:hypothetical protein